LLSLAAARARPHPHTGFSKRCGTYQLSPKQAVKTCLLDEVDVITGVFGGSITALAYGLYGEKLFDDYETRFLKCNVQGELTTRVLRPLNWGHCRPLDGGRSELAAQLYDEI
jgi:NTE family protein